MNEIPSVSCLCITYGRPHLLEEAIQSFIIQDYIGEKELIILNDLEHQTLKLKHPLIKIINVPKRFHSVGEKRSASVALASHDLLFVWDDDDIHLPHRISYSVKMIDKDIGFFKVPKAWTLNNNILSGPTSNAFHGCSCWMRSLYEKARCYAPIGSGQDVNLENIFRQHDNRISNYQKATNSEIYYIYRWGGTGSFHLSGFGPDKPGQKTCNQKVSDWITPRLGKEIPIGEIILNPHWKNDYISMVNSLIALSKPCF